MQQYGGPRRRVIRKSSTGSQLKIDGIVNHTEDRAIYVQQEIKITQKKNLGGAHGIDNAFLFEEEKEEFARDANTNVPFRGTHEIVDRFLVNKSLKNLTFKSDQAHNHLTIQNEVLYNLAPLLASEKQFKNVTRLPEVITDKQSDIHQSVYVQHSAYSRMWFGFLSAVTPPNGHQTGLAPFILVDPTANWNAAGNNPVSSVFGFSASDGVIVKNERNRLVDGYQNGVSFWGEYGMGQMEWIYNSTKDRYELPPAQITLKHYLDDRVVPAHEDYYEVFTTPLLHTSSRDDKHPNTYIFSDDLDDYLPTPADITDGAGQINYTWDMYDFVRIPLGLADTPQDANADEHVYTIYWFIPSFRIVRGNNTQSIARPIRISDTVANVQALPWIENFNPVHPNVLTTAHALLPDAEVNFWAHFHSTREFEFNSEVHWEYPELGTFRAYVHSPAVVGAGGGANNLSIMFRDDLPADMEAIVQQIKTLVVDQRETVLHNINTNQKHIWLLVSKDGGDTMQYFRMNLDEINRYRDLANADAAYLSFDHGQAAVGGGNYDHAEIERQWDSYRSIQIDQRRAHGGFTCRHRGTPFKNRRMDESLAFINRSVFEMRPQHDAVGNLGSTGDLRTDFGNVGAFTTIGAAYNEVFPALGNNAFVDGHDYQWTIYFPRRLPIVNTVSSINEVTVKCCEPFFGYSSGCTQLQTEHPLNFAKFGKEFPLLLQDYQYDFDVDTSRMLTNGYLYDGGHDVVISEGTPEFVTMSNNHVHNQQGDKDTMSMREISPTFEVYKKQYSTLTEPVVFEFESRSGNFEYLFAFIRYAVGDNVLPKENPRVTGITLRIKGRENQFLKKLDEYDLERLSHDNAHELCQWRELHELGQGVLIHLGDIGLTEEKPFPERKRIQFRIELTSERLPKKEVIYDKEESVPGSVRVVTLALIRQNQMLSGDVRGLRFEYLNEMVTR